jgi:alpha-1,2-mannosyltransferase/arabinofuranan 3-O-arabinosyltransferase
MMPGYGRASYASRGLGLGKIGGPKLWDAVFITVGFWVLALSLWMDVRVGGGILERISTTSMDVHADFDSFWRSARALLAGEDVYDTGARLVNLNPPVWTVLISPLGLLEVLTAYRVFVVISLVVSVGYLAWTAEEARPGPAWAMVGGVMLLLSSPLLSTLALGQVYPVLALGLVAAWMADRRDKQAVSGGALGLVVALKPSLLPVLLWPLVRRQWRAFGAALAAGAAATLVGVIVVGPGATLDYIGILRDGSASPYWDNASLPGAAARLFTDNPYAEHAATLPWTIYVAYALGIGAVFLTAMRVRHGPEAGLWALVAASLLASPIAWHNYLVLLGPGILLLLARGRAGPAFLLLALQSIPAQWPLIWNDEGTVAASLSMTLYLYILVAHWLVLLAATGETGDDTEPVPGGTRPG